MKWLCAAALTLAVACSSAPTAPSSGRYRMATHRTTRSNFAYVMDVETQRWANRECELRVSTARALPDPLSGPEHGTQLSVQLFKPVSVESAYFHPNNYEMRDQHRVWLLRHVGDEGDLTGRSAYGVQVQWFWEGEDPTYDALEMIRMPPLGNQPPGVWSEWSGASSLREGAFGWWEEAHGKAQREVKPPEYPFELRCRVFLADTPGVLP